MNSIDIAFIGGGHMGRALIGGLVRRGTSPQTIRVGEPGEAVRASLERDFGCRVSADNDAAAAGADAVVIAVKPQEAARVVAALGPRLRAERPLVISIAAGIDIRSLDSWCGAGVPIVRAMPNRPALVGAGVTGLHAAAQVGSAGRALAESILRAVGAVVWLEAEKDLDVVTALSGSGPAYCFLLAEQMMQAAVKLGLDPQAARVLAVETLHGAGVLAHAGSGDLARLRAEVTSKGGTTEAALRVLEAEPGLGSLVERAVDAAAQRSRELARQFGVGG
ncbi:MAG: pyrroline-5-carboxylate reductase [Steroidobacteraceae bacterium]